MVEVFRTNVNDKRQAEWLAGQIEINVKDHNVNFDLDDCDNILRVETTGGRVKVNKIVRILREVGFDAEILPDDVPSVNPEAWCILRAGSVK